MNHKNKNQRGRSIMRREVSAMEARQKFGELLDEIYYRDEQVIIKRADKPMAALISIQSYQQFLKQRNKDFSVLDRVWAKNPILPEEEVEHDIAVAISEVRSEKSEKRTK